MFNIYLDFSDFNFVSLIGLTSCVTLHVCVCVFQILN